MTKMTASRFSEYFEHLEKSRQLLTLVYGDNIWQNETHTPGINQTAAELMALRRKKCKPVF
jgi:hypothetical protein